MQTVPFGSPVHVRCANQSVKSIRSVREGFDFLLACQCHDGPLFESALEACFSALANPDYREDARRGLLAFAHAHGYLAELDQPHISSRQLRVTWRTASTRQSPARYQSMRPS